MAPWSISRRLAATLLIAVSGLWLFGAAAAALVIYHELNEAFDNALQQATQRLLPLAVRALDANEAPGDSGPRVRSNNDESMMYQVRGPDGRVLLKSRNAPQVPFPAPVKAGYFRSGGLRFYGEQVPERQLVVQVAEPLSHRVEAMVESLIWLTAPLLVVVPLAGFGVYRTVRRTVRPIAVVREEIRRRGGADLSPIPVAGLPAELAPIIHDVNRLLQRLERSLESERRFSANSAHGLRTPVAAALAQAQLLESRLAGGGDAIRAAEVVRTLRGLADLVDKLLQLSRAQGGMALGCDAADLMPVIRLLADDYGRRLSTAGRLRLDDGGTASLTVRIDIDAFAIALRNLLDNALAHSPAGTPVELTVAPDGSIHVVNAGPPVSAAELTRLAGRFERGSTATAGSGLGLAITEAVMRQSGGELGLLSPASGRADGFEAVLRFDRAEPGAAPARDGSAGTGSSVPRSVRPVGSPP